MKALTDPRRAADVAPKTAPRVVNIADLAKIFRQDFTGARYADLVSPAGGECNHPVAVRVNNNGAIVETTGNGTQMYFGAKPSNRGTRVEIDLDPETADDPWTLALYFHKGHTYLEILQRRGNERTCATIWRD